MSKLVVEVDDFARAARAMRHEVAENVELCLSAVAGRLQPELVGVDPAGVAWAADYDPAARSVLAASALLANGAYRTSQLLAASGRNYALAEHASTTGGGGAVQDSQWTVLLADQPSVTAPHVPSAGGAGHDTPADWWLVEHTIGILWPGGHQDRLRATADAWRSAARSLDAALGVPLSITADFVLDNLPEADNIRRVSQGLYNRLTTLITGHHALADACDQYATHLDTCHHEIENELADLVRDTVITQTAGAALSVISFGLAQVPTQATQAARITLAANRIRTLIDKLLTAAKLLATTIARTRRLADDIHHAMHQLATTRLAYAGVTNVPRMRRAVTDGRRAQRGLRMEREADNAGGLYPYNPAVPQPAAFKPPPIKRNGQGNLTNGDYTVSRTAMQKHVNGKLQPDASQFLHNVDADRAVLDAAAYAKKHNLIDSKGRAKVKVENGPVGVTGADGALTDWVNIYVTKSGKVHGCPGRPPR